LAPVAGGKLFQRWPNSFWVAGLRNSMSTSALTLAHTHWDLLVFPLLSARFIPSLNFFLILLAPYHFSPTAFLNFFWNGNPALNKFLFKLSPIHNTPTGPFDGVSPPRPPFVPPFLAKFVQQYNALTFGID